MAADVAAVLFSTGNKGFRESAPALMQCAIGHEAAFIIADDVAFAREIGADGVHITGGIEAYKAARSELGKDRIAGLATALNRHDSMCGGEAGADYIFFDPGISNPRSLSEEQPLASLIEWWSGMFQVPCVAGAQHEIEKNRTLIQAGVDFLSLDNSLWKSEENTINTLKYISNLIAECGRQ